MTMLIPSDDVKLKEDCVLFDFETGYKTEDGYVLQAKELYEVLRDEMIKEKAVGLSACQIGYMVRVFVFGDFMNKDSIIGVFNPTITNYSEEQVTYEEACCSFPGMFIKVKRPRIIRVRYLTWNNESGTANYEGYTARVFQHEYDHLNGIAFHQRANRYHLEKAKKQKVKLDRMLKIA